MGTMLIEYACGKLFNPEIKTKLHDILINSGNPQIDETFIEGYFEDISNVRTKLSINATLISLGLFSIFYINPIITVVSLVCAWYGVHNSRKYLVHATNFIKNARTILSTNDIK